VGHSKDRTSSDDNEEINFMIEQCPEIEIPSPKVFTLGSPLEFNVTSGGLGHHGLVQGTGTTPDAAFDDLSRTAAMSAYRLVQDNWQMIVMSDRDRIAQTCATLGVSELAVKIVLRGIFVIVSSRLTSGVLSDDKAGWVAYGTLASHPGLAEAVVRT
jgi:hypothetical protein